MILLQHYEHDQDGLCHRLTKPLVKLGKLDYHVSKQTFIDKGWIIKKEDLKLGEITGKGQFKGWLCVITQDIKDDTEILQTTFSKSEIMCSICIHIRKNQHMGNKPMAMQ